MENLFWILWSLLSSAAVCGYVTASKIFGQHSMLQGYLAFVLTAAAVGWIIPISYSKAPTFTHAFMLQQGFISVIGVIVGMLLFKDSLSFGNFVGISLITVGSLFMPS